MENKRPRIIDVLSKPVKCPVCGERVVDIIYGTGDIRGARDDKGDFSTHFKLAAKIVNLVWILLLFDK